MIECPCFHFAQDLDEYDDDFDQENVCECGHNLDEHDDDLDCKAEYVEDPRGDTPL